MMKDIKGYEGQYAITDNGEVWSYKRKKFLKQFISNNGYMRVSLWRDGEGKNYRGHRLVAEAFIPNPDNLPEVNHKDWCRTNNRLENLEWCDSQYNLRHRRRFCKC